MLAAASGTAAAEARMLERGADQELWRVFRLYMSTLSDLELETVSQHVEREILAQRERDADAARLLFSTLGSNELETARQQIRTEQQARLQDGARCAVLTGTKAYTRASANCHTQGPSHIAARSRATPKKRGSARFSASPAPNSLASAGRQSDECDDRGRSRAPKENRTEMPAFTISDDNNITVFATAGEAAEAACGTALVFESKAELARVAAEWPMSRLIEVYNSIPGNGEVKRFADRNKAVTRIWAAIQPLARNIALQPQPSAESETSQPANSTQPAKAAKARHKRTPGGPSRATASEPRNTRKKATVAATRRASGGKKAAVITMMKRAKGATLSEIMATTGWQAHTVRGMISILGSKGGVNVASSKNASGERTYRIPK